METETLKDSRLSHSGEKRVLEHKINVEDNDLENHWDSCCSKTGRTDRRLIEFSARFFLSVVMMSVSVYAILTADECDSIVPFWCSIISFVLGLNTPNTQNNKKK